MSAPKGKRPVVRRTRRAKRTGPLSPWYQFTVRLSRRGAWTTCGPRQTQKREAIRSAHRCLRETGYPAFVNVKTASGALIYQAHLNRDGRIVAEEL